jgi:hypothetical protein
MPIIMDYYSRLGVRRKTATPQEIEAAYGHLESFYLREFINSELTNTDQTPSTENTELLNAIRIAYETLSNPERRAEYDQSLNDSQTVISHDTSHAEMSPISAAVARDDARHWLEPLFHGVHPSDFSPEVFKHQFLTSKFDNEQLVALAIKNYSIAKICLKDSRLFYILTLSSLNILSVCEAHESIALKFISEPTLYDKFTSHPTIFYQLAENSPMVCKAILNSPELCFILTGEHIAKLKNQYGIAMIGETRNFMDIAYKYRAFQKLTPLFEGDLPLNYTFAQFKKIFVIAKGNAQLLSSIAVKCLPIADACLNDGQFRLLLMESPHYLKKLGIAHETIALKIIRQQIFWNMALSNSFIFHSFAIQYFSACKELLSTPSLRNTLTGKQLYNLLVVHGYKAAVLIKNIPELHRRLEEYVLLRVNLRTLDARKKVSHAVLQEKSNGKSWYQMGEAFLNLKVANNTQIAMGYFLKAACAAAVNEDPEGIKLALDAAQLTPSMLNKRPTNLSPFTGVDSNTFETASFLTNDELNNLFPILLNYIYEKQSETLHTQLAESYLAKLNYAKAKKTKVTEADLEKKERQEIEETLRQPRYMFARYNTALPYLMRAVMNGDEDAKRTQRRDKRDNA